MNLGKTGIAALAMAALMCALVCSANAQDVPAGVRYKKTTDEINAKAKRILEDALSAKAVDVKIEVISEGAIMCGPLLWDAIKDKAPKQLHDANKVVLMMQGPTPLQKEGRGISKPDDKRTFWTLFADNVRGSNSSIVRKAEAAEIRYYWATIPFDIEEPFYIVDLGKIRVLVNFIVKNGEPKIFWMDIVGDLKTLK